ncbi:hemophore [Mycobacterium sp. SMC-4]|uniref:hemophore n=1 Tax=Mycobacterium sp. SMC-4 TaxID=2857059 RepID=UPI0021B44610|nr:hemophore [Mycobacterium sp. SMC-4]UXA18325.1 hemophore [Mycobacterium sp. SMC-4]
MKSIRPARRLLSRAGLAAGCGAVVVAGSALPTAVAAPDPCAASSIAKTVGMVAVHTGNYLDANPETDQTLTAISQQQSGPESVAALKAYFDANPAVASDLQKLQQPLTSLSGRCGLPINVPQVLGLLQTAAQNPAAGAPAEAVAHPVSPVTPPGPVVSGR